MAPQDHYEDILHLPHHVLKSRPPMPMSDRAAQFAPFAALTGFGASIRETARRTDEQADPDEQAMTVLNRKLRLLAAHLADAPELSVIYFCPDARKSGGAYQTAVGAVRKIDESARLLVMQDGTQIPLDAVLDMESALFAALL